MKDEEVKNLINVAGCLVWLCAFVPLSLWRGFVLAKLWGWYIVPLGAPLIGWVHAVGLSVFFGLLLSWAYKSDKDETPWHVVARASVVPAFSLLFGWVWHCFM